MEVLGLQRRLKGGGEDKADEGSRHWIGKSVAITSEIIRLELSIEFEYCCTPVLSTIGYPV